jgi:hypothetical protein
MAATAAMGVFASLTLVDFLAVETPISPPLAPNALLIKLLVSAALGATFLLWWPIVGRGLRRIGIKW